MELKKSLENLNEDLKKLKINFKSIYNGIFAIKEILEEKNLVEKKEIEERWKEKEELLLEIEDQIYYLNEKKDKIISNFKGKNFIKFNNYLKEGIKRLEFKDMRGAEEKFSLALKNDPTNTELLNFMAYINLQKSSLKKAGNYLKKAISFGENEESIFLYCWYMLSKGKCEEALKKLKKFKNKYKNSYLVNLGLGNLNYSLKNYKDSISFFKKAVKINDNPYLNYFLFKCHEKLLEYKNAIPYLLKIKDEKTFREEALYNLSKFYINLERKKLAKNFSKELICEYPDSLKNHIIFLIAKDEINFKNFRYEKERLAELFIDIEKKKFKKANSKLQRLIKIYPNEKFFFISLGIINFILKKYENSMDLIKRFFKEKCSEIERILIYVLYLECLRKIFPKRTYEGIANDFYLNCSSKLGKAIALIFLSQAVLKKNKEEEKAIIFAKEAIEELPEELKYYGIENFGYLLYESGEKEIAFKILNEVSSSIKEENLLLDLGKIALNLGKVKEAKKIFKSARKNVKKSHDLPVFLWNEIFKEIRSLIL